MSAHRTIDAIIDDLLAGRRIDYRTAQLKQLGSDAARGLLEHLAMPDRGHQTLALFGLQHCWSDVALEPVSALLGNEDGELRHMAAIVLDRALGREGLARACAPFVGHPDANVAAHAFNYVEAVFPDLERMETALRNPALRYAVCAHLPRYYSSRLTDVTRTRLNQTDPEIALSAAVGLMHQCDTSGRTQATLGDWLGSESAEYREIAAEYFTRLGDAGIVPALRQALTAETDTHARAALQGAIDMIERRNRSPAKLTAALNRVATRCAYRDLPSGDPDDSDAIRQRLCATEPYEPRWMYLGREPPADFSSCRRARVDLQRTIGGYPQPSDDANAPLPLAQRLIPPVRDYALARHNSYGVHTDKLNRAFKSAVHVGDDIAWHCDNRTVTAMADGRVTTVGAIASWGYLVIVEHEVAFTALPDCADLAAPMRQRYERTIEQNLTGEQGGLRLCSVYAHLDPFTHVTVGQCVSAGDKLGTTGRAYTWENGGYPSHLHFAVHLGPYRQTFHRNSKVDITYKGKRYRGRVVKSDENQTSAMIFRFGGYELVVRSTSWLSGYASKWAWETNTHGWLDPRKLLSIRDD